LFTIIFGLRANVSRNIASISTIVIQVNRFLVRSWWFTPKYSRQPIARPFHPFRLTNLQTGTLVIEKEVLFNASGTYSLLLSARWSWQQFRNKRPLINFSTLCVLCIHKTSVSHGVAHTLSVYLNARRNMKYENQTLETHSWGFSLNFNATRINKTLK